jgi:thiamine-monophosphate kinase
MDVSDGLAGDLAKLCAASSVSADIALPHVPISSAAAELIAARSVELETLISGGDDYEILCTVPAVQCETFRAAAETAGVAVTDLGAIVEGTHPPRFMDGQGRPVTLTRLSYSHF